MCYVVDQYALLIASPSSQTLEDLMLDRIVGVFKLDVNTFEEIEADQTATGQAALVVLIVAFVGALGSGYFAETGFVGGFFSSLVGTFFGWIVWSAITYFVGTSLFGGQADMGEMLRVIGFAYAPQILGIIPCLGTIIGAIWTLIAGFIAVRQGLDLDNAKAFMTIVIGFIAYLVLLVVVGMIFGVSGMALGALGG